MQRCQYTLKDTVEFSGVGIHTGTLGRLRIHPAEAGFGIAFRGRENVIIPARSEYVVKTSRSTSLGCNECTISTVEHLMAAFWGLHIDNALVEFEGCEVPILDGSARYFVEGFRNVGLRRQDEIVKSVELERPYFVTQGDSLVLALPADVTSYEAQVCYHCPEVGAQAFTYCVESDFYREVAPARTFGFWEEIKQLLSAGLALGGSLSNALIFGCPKGELPSDGPADDMALKAGFRTASGMCMRFENEAVRHKVLDLVGDIALYGHPIQAHFIAVRAGHSLHVNLVRKLREELGNVGN